MAMPDKIEDVNADQLINIVETDPFVTGDTNYHFKCIQIVKNHISSFLL